MFRYVKDRKNQCADSLSMWPSIIKNGKAKQYGDFKIISLTQEKKAQTMEMSMKLLVMQTATDDQLKMIERCLIISLWHVYMSM